MDATECRPPATPLVDPGRIDHMSADMTVTFAADVTLAALQATLAEKNQWLPIDGDPALPLSDLVHNNSTGPLRLGYGAWRDVLLGAQFINGREELISVGGRVLKNVAGYDVTKFLVGSHGLFGTSVTFTARTWRRPACALNVTLATDAGRFGPILTTPLRPHWAVLTADGLHLGYHGDDATVGFYESRVAVLEPRQIPRIDLTADDAARQRLWPADPAFRVSLPPARIGEFVAAAKLQHFSADAAFGIVVAPRQESFNPKSLAAEAKRCGGTITIFNELRRPVDLWLDPAAYAILQRLKTAFDPDGTLAPLPPNRA